MDSYRKKPSLRTEESIEEENKVVNIKVDPLSDDEILDEFDDAARKARATAKEEIQRVSYEAGGSVNVDFAKQE